MFLGTAIDEDSANLVIAQLLFLEGEDADKSACTSTALAGT